MRNLRRMLGIMVCCILMSTVAAFATPVVPDDFSGETINPQWTTYTVGGGTVQQTGGSVHTVINGAATDQRAGYNPTAGYVLSGDFDISIEFETLSYTQAANSYILGVMSVVDVVNSANNFNLQNRSVVKDYSGQWYMLSFINGVSQNHTAISSEDAVLRLTRTGSDIAIYGKALADEEWTLLRSSTGFSTNDMSVKFYSQTLNNGILTANWDNFTVPEPATLAIIAAGAVGFIRRRK